MIPVRKERGQTTSALALPRFITAQILFKVLLPWRPWESEGVGDQEEYSSGQLCMLTPWELHLPRDFQALGAATLQWWDFGTWLCTHSCQPFPECLGQACVFSFSSKGTS